MIGPASSIYFNVSFDVFLKCNYLTFKTFCLILGFRKQLKTVGNHRKQLFSTVFILTYPHEAPEYQ